MPKGREYITAPIENNPLYFVFLNFLFRFLIACPD
jgi:hypothetical protein